MAGGTRCHLRRQFACYGCLKLKLVGGHNQFWSTMIGFFIHNLEGDVSQLLSESN